MFCCRKGKYKFSLAETKLHNVLRQKTERANARSVFLLSDYRQRMQDHSAKAHQRPAAARQQYHVRVGSGAVE